MVNYLKQLVGFDDGNEEVTDAPFKVVDAVDRLTSIFQSQSERIRALRSPESLISWIKARNFNVTRYPEAGDDLTFEEVLDSYFKEEKYTLSYDYIDKSVLVSLNDVNLLSMDLLSGNSEEEHLPLALGNGEYVNINHVYETYLLSLCDNSGTLSNIGMVPTFGTLNEVDSLSLLKDVIPTSFKTWTASMAAHNFGEYFVGMLKVNSSFKDYLVSEGLLYSGQLKNLWNPDRTGVFYAQGDFEDEWYVAIVNKPRRVFTMHEGIHDTKMFYSLERDASNLVVQVPGIKPAGYFISEMISDVMEIAHPTSQYFLQDLLEEGQAITFKFDINGEYEENFTVFVPHIRHARLFKDDAIVDLKEIANSILLHDLQTKLYFSAYNDIMDFDLILYGDPTVNLWLEKSEIYNYVAAEVENRVDIGLIMDTFEDQADLSDAIKDLLSGIMTNFGVEAAIQRIRNLPNTVKGIGDNVVSIFQDATTTIQEKLYSVLSMFGGTGNPVTTNNISDESYTGVSPLEMMWNGFAYVSSHLPGIMGKYYEVTFGLMYAFLGGMINLVGGLYKWVRTLLSPFTGTQDVGRFRSFSIDETFTIPKTVHVQEVPYDELVSMSLRSGRYLRPYELKVVELIIGEPNSYGKASVTLNTFYRISDVYGTDPDYKLAVTFSDSRWASDSDFTRATPRDSYDYDFMYQLIRASASEVKSVRDWPFEYQNKAPYALLRLHSYAGTSQESAGFLSPYYPEFPDSGDVNMNYKIQTNRSYVKDPTHILFGKTVTYFIESFTLPPNESINLNPKRDSFRFEIDGVNYANYIFDNINNAQIADFMDSMAVHTNYGSIQSHGVITYLRQSMMDRVYVLSDDNNLDSLSQVWHSKIVPSFLPSVRSIHHAWKLRSDQENYSRLKQTGAVILTTAVLMATTLKLLKFRKIINGRLSILGAQVFEASSANNPDLSSILKLQKQEKKWMIIGRLVGVSTVVSTAGMATGVSSLVKAPANAMLDMDTKIIKLTELVQGNKHD